MDSHEYLKAPPHSVRAEQSVIGCILIAPHKMADLVEILSESDFYRREHQVAYAAMVEMSEAERPIDIITVAEWLEDRNQLDDVGGLAYLGSIAKDTPTAANLYAYARRVRDTKRARDLITVSARIADLGHDQEQPIADRIDAAQALISAVGEEKSSGGLVSAKSGMSEFVETLEQRFEAGDEIVGQPTGLADLDRILCGLREDNLVIVAGRPSMGKTTLAMNFAERAALTDGKAVAVFSLEMSKTELLERMTASVGRIQLDHLRSGQLVDEEWAKLTSAVHRISNAPLYIDDSPALTPLQVRARARRLHRKEPIGLIVVDYIQLMRGRGENQNLRVSDISQSLKALAKELHVPVIALSQLSRDVEKRPNKRPMMSDLRDSGSIEQDADVIVMVYRDAVYNPDEADISAAELIVTKQRGGTTGTARAAFLGHYNRFESAAQDYGDGYGR